MKKFIGFCLLCLMFFFYIVLGGCDYRSEDSKMMHRAVYTAEKTLKDRYQLQYIGISEAGGENYYKKVGLHFELFRIISKEEARKMLVGCVEEMLKEINSNPQLLPYLQPAPFTVKNIEIAIFIRHSDGKEVYHPDLRILTVRNGIISYSTDIPKEKYTMDYHTTEEESYEEALKIVQSEAPLVRL